MSAPPRPLFLIGFAAAGKTTVGRLVATRLGRDFVDLDDRIAAAAGRSPAELVGGDEPDFRRREADALAAVIGGGGAPVVATGGGAATWGDNLDRMRAAGLVVTLAVDLDTALGRAGAVADRPLLGQPRDRVEALYRRRAAVYRRAHAVVDTEGRAPAAVAGELVRLVAAAAALGRVTPWVVLGERSYPIVVDDAPLATSLGRQVAAGRAALVADSNLTAWIPAYRDALAGAGAEVHVEVVAAGEASKSMAGFAALAEALVAAGLDRHSTVYALGGGVIGDLAGFAAATLYRGVAVVQLPTTLVAMTDAAIGGKTAIDLPAGKNLVGAFHQPRLVHAHVPTLSTLPVRERRAGFGELWKYALLDGESLWAAVEAVAPWAAGDDGGDGDDLAPPPDELVAVIERAATLKAAVVSRDEREQTGERALLNLGHTVGHAIEAAADWRLAHGEAVGLGLIAAARVSHRLGLAAADLEGRVVEALRATGLPAALDPWLGDDVLARVTVDKKRKGTHIGFIACAAPGDGRVIEVAPAQLADLLRP